MFDTLQYYLISTCKHDKKISHKEFKLFSKEHDVSNSLLFKNAYDKLLPHHKELAFLFSAIAVLCCGSQQIVSMMGYTELSTVIGTFAILFGVLCIFASLNASMSINGPIVYMRDHNVKFEELENDYIGADMIGEDIWVGEKHVFIKSPNGMQICDKASIEKIYIECFKGVYGKELKDFGVITVLGEITIKKPVQYIMLWTYITTKLIEAVKK